MNKGYIKKLHNKVIHELKEKASIKAIYAEGRQIKRLDDNQLISICKDCFTVGN